MNRRILVAALAAFAALVLIGGVLFALVHGRKGEVTALDRRSLISAADLGIKADALEEQWTRERGFDGTVRAQYAAAGLGTSGKATVKCFRHDLTSATSAQLAFEGGKNGGRAGFAATAGKNEELVEEPVAGVNGDALFNAVYQVDHKRAGHFVLVRKGTHVIFLSLNGFLLTPDLLVSQLNSRLALLPEVEAAAKDP